MGVTVAEWRVKVLARLPGGAANARLRDMTNDTGSGAADTSVLDQVIESALGDVRTHLGLIADTDDSRHAGIVHLGVSYHSELIKAQSPDLIRQWSSLFHKALERQRRMSALAPRAQSPLVPSTQRQGTRPDFDRQGDVVKPWLEGPGYRTGGSRGSEGAPEVFEG